MSDQEPVLSLRGVSFQYRTTGQRIFSGLDLDIFPHEFVALIGDSGTGKTTLMRLLAGLYEPDVGTLTRHGSTRGGFVFQTPVLVEWLTAEQNVAFPDRTYDVNIVRSILRDVGLEHAAGSYASELSGGMRSRLQVARALYHRPDCMFLDEAFSQIQERLRLELAMLLKSLRSKYQFATVLSTHHLSDAVFLGDRIMVLHSEIGGPRRVQEYHGLRSFSRDPVDAVMSPAFQHEVANLRLALWDASLQKGVTHA